MDGNKFDIAAALAAAVPEIPDDKVLAWVWFTPTLATLVTSTVEQLAALIRADWQRIDHRFSTVERVKEPRAPGNSRGPRRRQK